MERLYKCSKCNATFKTVKECKHHEDADHILHPVICCTEVNGRYEVRTAKTSSQSVELRSPIAVEEYGTLEIHYKEGQEAAAIGLLECEVRKEISLEIRRIVKLLLSLADEQHDLVAKLCGLDQQYEPYDEVVDYVMERLQYYIPKLTKPAKSNRRSK